MSKWSSSVAHWWVVGTVEECGSTSVDIKPEPGAVMMGWPVGLTASVDEASILDLLCHRFVDVRVFGGF